jgi:hypothetical protein
MSSSQRLKEMLYNIRRYTYLCICYWCVLLRNTILVIAFSGFIFDIFELVSIRSTIWLRIHGSLQQDIIHTDSGSVSSSGPEIIRIVRIDNFRHNLRIIFSF